MKEYKISAGINCCIYCYRRNRTLRLVQLRKDIVWSNETKVCSECRNRILENPEKMSCDGFRYVKKWGHGTKNRKLGKPDLRAFKEE